VLDVGSVKDAVLQTLGAYGTVDLLVNGAGGSRIEATTSPELVFFDMPPEGIKKVVELNFMSAVIPSQEIGRIFAEKGSGIILNISSVAGVRPLTRSIAYCSGKAALINFTQWLSVHMARNYSPAIRVNAIAPGFILTEQNRFLLQDPVTKGPTERGKTILTHVPMGRLGKPEEIVGAALWLFSASASFVTGAVIPVDGGFTADSGV
jgi:NAD(P)-dependent dehydrogenase (short-subunit alcohol dehydrogenase family)